MTQERYFIGPGLRDKLRETITRVDGLIASEGGANVPTVVQDLPRRGGGTSIRMCKTIADWEVGSTQLVELWEYGDFPAEARNDPIQRFTAHNKLFRVKSGAFVYIGKAGNGLWYLIGAGRATADYNPDGDGGLALGCAGVAVGSEDLTSLPGYSAGKQQVLSHVSGCLRWVDVVGCSA